MNNFLHLCLCSFAVKVGIIIALVSRGHVQIYLDSHLFNYLLVSHNVLSSVLGTEDTVENKPRSHPCVYGVWSGWGDVYHCIHSRMNFIRTTRQSTMPLREPWESAR